MLRNSVVLTASKKIRRVGAAILALKLSSRWIVSPYRRSSGVSLGAAMVRTYKGRGHVPLQREGWLGESYPCHECARLLHSIPLATPSRSARKRWMQLAVILQSVQTPFRCVRRESDPTQSRNLSAELRIVSYYPPRCRRAQGDAVDRDNVLTRRDRPSWKEGKDLLLTRLGKVYDQRKCECMCVFRRYHLKAFQ